jgi:hypothetical protein
MSLGNKEEQVRMAIIRHVLTEMERRLMIKLI